MTIKEALKITIKNLKSAGIITYSLDARLLIEAAIEKDSVFLFANPERKLTNLEFANLRRLVKRRITKEPVAYILKCKEFFGHNFYVNKNVLIPRPETELLVEKGIEYLKKNVDSNKPVSVLDVGTGSGCIIISIAKTMDEDGGLIKYFASDISKKALAIAKKNSKNILKNNIIKFFTSNLFENKKIHQQFDLIVANLPYVSQHFHHSNDSKSKGIQFEPREAIFAEENGTKIIKNFLLQSKNYLKPNGLILLELDVRNAHALKKFALTTYKSVELKKDLSGRYRYLSINN